ncbi:hypothetical protein IT568_09990 [bacterium]|nr:hypothetical protein [bacterium]
MTINWRVIQTVVWIVGAVIFLLLLFAPETGTMAFWNVLIPVAPALVALAPGFWRNVCPLGTTSLIPRHLGFANLKRLSTKTQGRFAVAGVVLLFLIVPLRHLFLNRNGVATGLLLAGVMILAAILSFRYQWKSAWCSGLCPVHPVEKLYGVASSFSFRNAHCTECELCVESCPDSTAATKTALPEELKLRKTTELLLTGGFVGYIWGWFQVPDYSNGTEHLLEIFGMSFLGFGVTLSVFYLLRFLFPEKNQLLSRIFTAAAISCYYWYRLPSLFGFGEFQGDGMLVDLSVTLPDWFPVASRFVTTSFFLWWFAIRTDKKQSWLVRPQFSKTAGGKNYRKTLQTDSV